MGFKFLKAGNEGIELAKKQAAEQAARMAEQGKLFRFWLKDKEEARITFVDGDLNEQGFLAPPRYYEHNLMLNGQWNNYFLCPEKTNPDANDPCPICASGERPYIVALFTIIDHRTYVSQKGNTYVNTKKLLVAKPQTFELLNKIAMKRGGLTGCTFDVSRSGAQAASVGSMFDFVEKRSVAELKQMYMVEKVDPKTNVKVKVTNFEPADYEGKEITYRTGAELAALGLGTKNPLAVDTTASGKKTQHTDYSDQL